MQRTDLGSIDDLTLHGRLTGKHGSLPVLVVWDGSEARAIEDRCPHLGFPLHRGTTADGLITCHWHHARFDLASGCALDPWADDAVAFDVELTSSGRVEVLDRAGGSAAERWERRLRDALEHSLTLVTAKAVHELVELPGGEHRILRTAYDFGDRYLAAGWGSSLTVLTCMANLLPHLHPADRPSALIHALTGIAAETAGSAPRFGQPAMGPGQTAERLAGWYREFAEVRNADGAERALATAIATGDLAEVERTMFATATDHVYLDGGHTLDFTNKAFEALQHLGPASAGLLTGLVGQTCRAERSEESGEWQHPHDLVGLVAATIKRLGAVDPTAVSTGAVDVSALAWRLLADDPVVVADTLVDGAAAGATIEELARAVAFACALRLVRFHVNNDPGDWDTVHHSFTFANAVHAAVVRRPTAKLLRGVVHGAMRVYLDRFLNVPAARVPTVQAATLDDLAACWDSQGLVDRAGEAVWGCLHAGVDRADVIAALGHALLQEDAAFHSYQSVEAGVRQALAWPEGSAESALVLVGVARFLAARTPTRRDLLTVTRTAVRLRRGEAVFEA